MATSSEPLPPPPSQPAAPPPAPATWDGDRVLAAVAYILTIMTGLIVYLVAKPEDKYARWHAIQAIGLGVAILIVTVVLSVLVAIVVAAATLGSAGLVELSAVASLVTMLWVLLVIVLVIVMAIKAYQGEKVRLPVIADIADRNA